MGYPIVDDYRLARMFASRKDADNYVRKLEVRQAKKKPVHSRTYTVVCFGVVATQYAIAVDCVDFKRRMYVGD